MTADTQHAKEGLDQLVQFFNSPEMKFYQEMNQYHSIILGRDIKFLGLSNGVVNALHDYGIHAVSSLVARTENDLRKVPSLGRKRVLEIRAVLAKHCLRLSWDDEWYHENKEKVWRGIL